MLGPIISENDPPLLATGVTYLEKNLKLCSYNVGRIINLKKKYIFFYFNARIVILSYCIRNVSLLNYICIIYMCTILYICTYFITIWKQIAPGQLDFQFFALGKKLPNSRGWKSGKYFNIVDLCGILPYKRMCPHLCGRIIYNCISSSFLYYNQYAWVQISFVMIS